MSHKGNHSVFSEILLGREKSSGEEGGVSDTEDDKGDHNGFAEIMCDWGMIEFDIKFRTWVGHLNRRRDP